MRTAGLLALVAIAFYGRAWAALMLVRFIRRSEKRHSHDGSEEIGKGSPASKPHTSP